MKEYKMSTSFVFVNFSFVNNGSNFKRKLISRIMKNQSWYEDLREIECNGNSELHFIAHKDFNILGFLEELAIEDECIDDNEIIPYESVFKFVIHFELDSKIKELILKRAQTVSGTSVITINESESYKIKEKRSEFDSNWLVGEYDLNLDTISNKKYTLNFTADTYKDPLKDSQSGRDALVLIG